MDRCQMCGRNVPTKYVEFYQNIGMLVMRSMRSVKGNLCRQCAKSSYLKLTGLTLVTGWWGMISAIINPLFILNNTIRYVGCLRLPDGGEQAFPVQSPAGRGAAVPGGPSSAALTSFQHDIQMRLRGGQSAQEIAQYIAPRAGVPLITAQKYVESVNKPGA